LPERSEKPKREKREQRLKSRDSLKRERIKLIELELLPKQRLKKRPESSLRKLLNNKQE
jgi:hypothetical protein